MRSHYLLHSLLTLLIAMVSSFDALTEFFLSLLSSIPSIPVDTVASLETLESSFINMSIVLTNGIGMFFHASGWIFLKQSSGSGSPKPLLVLAYLLGEAFRCLPDLVPWSAGGFRCDSRFELLGVPSPSAL